MKFTEIFRDEIFRPVITLLIPGGILLGPTLLLLTQHYPAIGEIWESDRTSFLLIALGLAFVTGLLLENAGSRLEAKCFDKRLTDNNEVWRKYLLLELKDEIIAQRYIRSMVIRLKFELASFWAFGLAIIPLVAWQISIGINLRRDIPVTVLLVLLSMLTYYDAKASAQVLHNRRRDLLEREHDELPDETPMTKCCWEIVFFPVIALAAVGVLLCVAWS